MKRVSPLSAVRGSDAIFPNDFGEDLLHYGNELLVTACCSVTFACTNVTAQSTTAGSLLIGQTDLFFVADNAVTESAYVQVTQ